jgi:predicted RNA-binding protein with PUA-like domain
MIEKKYWLLKSEPETYSFDQLIKDKKTNWNNVRNYQARNYLKEMRKGDIALIYHSGKDKAVVGIAEITKEHYPDFDKNEGESIDDGWVQVDLKPIHKFLQIIPLTTIKNTATLKDMPLIKQSRLSVMPITEKHFETFKKLGQN